MRCDQCKHWDESDDWDFREYGTRRCLAIKQAWDVTKGPFIGKQGQTLDRFEDYDAYLAAQRGAGSEGGCSGWQQLCRLRDDRSRFRLRAVRGQAMNFSQITQLARDWHGTLPADGMAWEEKHNGWRAICLPDHLGEWKLWTRNGHPIEGTGHIVHRLAEMREAAGKPMVVDGEFVVDGPDTLAATKHWCETGWKQGGEAGTFHVFDCLTHAEWRAGGTDRPWIERKAMLAELVKDSAGDGWTWRAGSHGRDERATPVALVEDGWCFTEQDAIDEARRIWARDGEGIMLKDPLSPYRRNRTDAWLRVKQENAHKWRMAA